MATYPSIYRAKATKVNGSSLTAYVPQIFGDVSITISDFVGTPAAGMGWVLFQGGSCEHPVWVGEGLATASTSGGTSDSGTSVSQFDYKWKTNTSASDPLQGYVKVNNTDPALATEIYMSYYDTSGRARVTLTRLVSGDSVWLYQPSDINKRVQYVLSSDPTNTGNLWFSATVTATNYGFAPNNNTDIIALVETPGGGGGSGGVQDVMWVSTAAPSDPAIELWYDTDEPVGTGTLVEATPKLLLVDTWASLFDNGNNKFVIGQSTTTRTTTGAVSAGVSVIPLNDVTSISAGVCFVTNAGTATQQIHRTVSVAALNVTVAAPVVTALTLGQSVPMLWTNSSHLTSPGISAYAYAIANAKDSAGNYLITGTTPKVTYLGNSWFAGSTEFASKLQARIPGAVIVNAGVGGNKSSDMITRFAVDVPSDSDYVVFNEPGVNDVYQLVTPRLQSANLETLFARTCAIGAVPVFVGTAPLVDWVAYSTVQHDTILGQISDGSVFPAITMSAVSDKLQYLINPGTSVVLGGRTGLSMTKLTTGGSVAGLGDLVFQDLTTGVNNVGVGRQAMQRVTVANNNTAVGQAALGTLVNGTANSALGQLAGLNVTASYNTLLGKDAGYTPNGVLANATTVGNGQTCAGYQTGQGSATGRNYITCIGHKAVADGHGAVAIGSDSTGAGAAAVADNEIALGTANHKLRVRGTVGFYGAAAVAQPTSVTPKAALETLGLGATLIAPINVRDYGAKGDGVTNDVTAIQAAFAAAEARGKGTIVFFPAGIYEVGTGLSLSGRSCQLQGEGAAGSLAAPTGTVFRASTQAGPVLNFVGWLQPDAFHARITHGGFWVQGSNVADPTKANSGVRLGEMSSATFRDIAVGRTGGPCWEHAIAPTAAVYLCDFERIICTTPVSAAANDVPYVKMIASNGNRFRGWGLRSVTSGPDVGVSGAVVLVDDGTFAAHDNYFDAWWVEFLHLQTNATVFALAGNMNMIANTQFFDTTKEVGATGTSFFRLTPPAVNDYGGNQITGRIPGKGTATNNIDMGIDMRQSRNSVRGIKGYRGTNVVIAAGINNTDIDLGGAEAASIDPAVVDNSATNTHREHDGYLRVENIGAWRRESGTANRNGPRFIDQVTPAEGGIHIGAGGIRMVTTGAGLYANADSAFLRNLASTGSSRLYFGTQATNPFIYSAAGTPEAAVAAPIGSLFMRTDGGANTTLYVKESGTGNTGWIAK